MKHFNGRLHSIWIFICIFVCVTGGKAFICNQHGREHSRTFDGEDGTTNAKHSREPNIEVHPYEHKRISDHASYKGNAVSANKQVIHDVNNDKAGQFNIEALPNENNIIEHPYYYDGQITAQNYINNFDTKDLQYNYSKNRGEMNSQLHGISTIYLAGYDNQIINLMNDIQKHGIGREVLVYFYLYTNNNFRNIGNFYTNKNILRDCITRYTHYFCVGHNRNDCSCLRNEKSNDIPVVHISPEVENEELNKIDHPGNTSDQKFYIKSDVDKFHNINGTTSEVNVIHPKKQSIHSYEFIPPGKDVFVDVLHHKPSEVLVDNKMIQSLDNVNNDAEHKVELTNNIVLGNNVASSLPKLDQQNIHELRKIPDPAINVEPITILTTTSNLNNNLNYMNGIIDQRHTLIHDVPNIIFPDTETSAVLQLSPITYEKPDHIPDISNPNKQLLDGIIDVKPDVQNNPNLEPQNMILRETTALPITNIPIAQTNDPKISNEEYVSYSQYIPDQTFRNTDRVNQALGIVSDIPLTLTPSQINGALEMKPNLEYANDIKDSVSKKLNDDSILMNPIQSNTIIEVNGVIPEINKENKIALETNAIDGQILNNNSNFITIDNNPNQNESNDDVVVCAPSTPTLRKLEVEQGNLFPDTNTAHVNKDIGRSFTVESGSIKNTENDVPSYGNYINSHLHELNIPLVVNEENNIKSQCPHYSNIDPLVNSNYYNIPTFSTNSKEVPQSNVRNHNNYGFHVNAPPYNYINYQLIQNKPQLHRHHSSNFLQNDDVLKQYQSRFQILDQPYKIDVRGQWPYNLLQTNSEVIDGYYDLQGKNQYNHGLTKPNINQNKNIYTSDPVKYIMPSPNVLKHVLTNHKNIVRYLEPVTGPKAESILDLPQNNLDDKFNQRNLPEVIITTQFREKSPPKNFNSWKNYNGNELPENNADYDNNPLKYNNISSPITFLPHYPYTGKHFYPSIGSVVNHMLDPCTIYKNIPTLEGYSTVEISSTPATPKELTDKRDPSLVDYNEPSNNPHIFDGFVPTYDQLHIPASITSKLNMNAQPINSYYNTYLSNLSQIGNKLTPLISEIDLSDKDQYDFSNVKKPAVLSKHTHPEVESFPIFSIDNEVPRTEEKRPLAFDDNIENNVLHKDSLVEQAIKHRISKIQPIPEYIGQMTKSIPSNKFGLSGSVLHYQQYLLNQKPFETNNPFRIPFHSHSLFPSNSKPLIGVLQPENMSNIEPFQSSTVTSETQPLADDVIVTGLPNNDNSNPMILNNALLQNVPPTVLNTHHKKVENSVPNFLYSTIKDPFYHPSSSLTVTPMTAYYPFTSVPINTLKYTTTVSHADLSSNSLLPCSAPGFIEQKPCPSKTQYVPKSINFIPLKVEPITTDTQTSATHSQNPSNLQPLTLKAVKNENVLAPSSVLPLSTLMQDTSLSSIPSYEPIPVLKALLPSTQYKKEPSLLEGKKLNSIRSYSKSVTPIQPFIKASSNYVTVPSTTTSLIPHYHPSKIPFHKVLQQNVVKYESKFPSISFSSAPELSVVLPCIKTQDIKSFSDTGNYPCFSQPSPFNVELSSMTQQQNAMAFAPNSYKTDSNTSYGHKYPTPTSINPNILKSQNYSEFLSTLSSIDKPLSFKSNLDIKHIHSQHNNAPSFAKPSTLSDQELQKYLTPIQNRENLSPDLVSSANDKMPFLYQTADLKPLVFSPNHLLAPSFTNSNKVPCKLLNNDVLQSWRKTVSHRVGKVLPVQRDAESIPLAISKISFLPMQNLTKHYPHYSVQPSQYSKNFANLIPFNTISPYSDTPGPSHDKVTWTPLCKFRKEPNQCVNGINNNFASIYPTVEFWSKGFPFRYTGYGLPTEIPKCGQPSQVTYLEPKPFNQIANMCIDSLIDEPKLDSQPTITTLGLQGQAISVKDQPTQIKPLSNSVLPCIFLGREKPESSSYQTFIPSLSSYLQNEVSSTQSSLNKMSNYFTTSNTVIPKPDLDTSSSSELSPVQENKLLPNIVIDIPLTQGAPSDLAVSPSSISALPINPVLASIDFEGIPKPASNLSVNSLSSSFHSQYSSPLNSNSNNLNTLWTYLFKSKDKKPLLRNLTPFHMDVSSTPVIDTASTYSSTAKSSNEMPASVLTNGLLLPKSISKPILPNQYLSSSCHGFPAQILQNTENSLDTSRLAFNINKPNQNFPNYQESQPIISTELNPKTSNLSTKTNLLKNRKFTSAFLSSDPIYVSSHSKHQQSVLDDLPISTLASSPMKVSHQTALGYSSGSPTSLPSSSICSPSGPLLLKALPLYIHKPDLAHDANTWPTPSSTNASSVPHTHISTLSEKVLDEAQLKPNKNLPLLSSTYLPYDTIDQNKVITIPSIRENLPQAYTFNTPCLKTLEKSYIGNMEQPNVKIINKMNNYFKEYIEQSDIINNVQKLIEVPLNNIGIVQYEPTKACKVSYLETDNPDIYLKVWPSLVKMIKPTVVLEIDKLQALNFCPIVKDKKIPYTNDEVQKLVEVFVKKYYGEPIIVKTEKNNSRVVVENIDESSIKNSKAYIVWANICDCGCNRMGCHCNFNLA